MELFTRASALSTVHGHNSARLSDLTKFIFVAVLAFVGLIALYPSSFLYLWV